MTIKVRLVRELNAIKSVQFTGKNSKDVALWVRKNGGEAKAGGSYVNILDESGDLITRVIKNDWLLLSSTGKFFIRSEADYRANYELVRDSTEA